MFRLASISDAAPNVLVVLGSSNDNGLTAIQAAATALYSAVLAASPSTKIIVIGPQLIDSSNPAPSAALAAAAAAAASTNGLGYIVPTPQGGMLRAFGGRPTSRTPLPSVRSGMPTAK